MLLRIVFATLVAVLTATAPSDAADATFTKEALVAAKAIKAGRNDEALATLGSLLKRYPKATDIDLIYWLTCKAYAGKANYGAAVSHCTEAIRRNPRNANFYADRGRAYALRGDAEAARRDLETAVAKGANRAAVHGLLARLYNDAGETAKAKAASDAALKLDAREKNALAVRVALRKPRGIATESFPNVKPMPRVPPPAKAPAAAVAATSPALPTRTASVEPAFDASHGGAPPESAANSSQAKTVSQPPTVVASAGDNASRPQTAKATAPLPPDAPSWWRNTPPVPAYRASRPPPPPRYAADTIDCARTQVPAERLVCADAGLLRRETEMDRLVRQVLTVAADEETVESDQRAWEIQRRNACRSRACLRAAYAERRLELLLWLDD